MVRVRDVVDVLTAEDALASAASIANQDDEVNGIAALCDAREGHAGWLSEAAYRRRPEVFFRGTVLLAPVDAAGHLGRLEERTLFCRNPKWAFSVMVKRLFPALLLTDWSSTNASVAADAVIGQCVQLGHGVVIGPRVEIAADCSIGPNTVIANTRIANRVRIGANCSIGLDGFGYEKGPDGRYVRFPHIGTVEIDEDVEIGSNTCIDRGALGTTRLARGVKVDNLVHIAHNVTVGENSLVIAHAMLAGGATVGSNVWVAPCASVINQAVIGDGVTIGMGSVVLKNVEPGSTVAGVPAKELKRRESTE